MGRAQKKIIWGRRCSPGVQYPLTLKCLSFFSLPFVHKGGPLGPPHLFEYFPVGISVRNFHHMCMHLRHLDNHISARKKKGHQKLFLFKMAAEIRIFVSRFKKVKWPKFKKKNSFPKEFFNETWLKVEEHECICISEIQFEKKIFCFKMADIERLRNNAYLC